MKKYKVNDRVNTIHGVGTVVTLQEYRDITNSVYRYGVKHDIYPKTFDRRIFDDAILFYNDNEICPVENGDEV